MVSLTFARFNGNTLKYYNAALAKTQTAFKRLPQGDTPLLAKFQEILQKDGRWIVVCLTDGKPTNATTERVLAEIAESDRPNHPLVIHACTEKKIKLGRAGRYRD